MRYQGTEVETDQEGLPVHTAEGSMCSLDTFHDCVDCGQNFCDDLCRSYGCAQSENYRTRERLAEEIER